MKLFDELVARAATADAAMDELARDEEAQENKRQAYGRLQQLFGEFAGDGYLDEKELSRLMADFKAQGLDTKSLQALYQQLKTTDGTKRVAVSADLAEQIGEQLQDAKYATRDPNFNFKAQTALNIYNQSFDAASRVQKAEHEIYMVAIRHLAG